MKQKSSLRNTICLVVEFLRHHLVEILQLLLLQDLGVQSCNAVYRVACCNRQMCHLNLSVVDNRHLANLLLIARILRLNLQDKTAVDLFDDLVYTRQQSGEQLDRPFFQCLCHDGVVRISTGLRRYLPCLIPAKSFLIQKDTHQLCDCYSRMGVVQLECCLLIEFTDIFMALLIFFNCCLYTCRDEEVLLLQTQFLTCIVIIIRIKDIDDVLCQILLLNSLLIITLIEGIKMEIIDCLCIPYTQGVDDVVVVAEHRNIIWNRAYRLVALLNKIVSLVLLIILHTHIATEFYDLRILRTAQLKRVAILEPVIRYFHLITILDFLLEHTITVTDTAAVCRISKRCKRIEEARCQTAKAAVSKCSIRLLILNHIEVKAHLIQRFLYFLICTQVDQIISKRTPHQKLHGHVINRLRIIDLILLLRCQPVIDDIILHRIGNSLKQLLLCCFFDCFPVEGFHILLNALFELFLVKCFTHYIFPFIQILQIGFFCLFSLYA